jgi:PAS domain S-box-containing protein
MEALPQPSAAPKASVQVVEDEAIIANDIKQVLEAGGYRVTSVVGTGARAVRKAEADRPDLVLMDIVLPGELDGIQAARLIRARQDIPVIYLTAYTDESIVARALDSEPFGYIVKPFSESELFRTIEIGLFKHRLEKRLKESEEWLATILRSIGDAVIATGRDGVVRFMNPAAEELLGWTREEVAGKTLAEILVIKGRGPLEAPGEALAGSLDPDRAEQRRGDYLIVTRRGEEKTVTTSSAPIVDRNRNVLGTVLALRDITATKAAEEELRRSREDLKIRIEEVQERNTALKVLLGQRESDRGEFEERIMANVRTLILPYLDKLKTQRLDQQAAAFLNIVETNLLQLTSGFSRRLSSHFHGLSPQEIRIANLVMEGRQDKEIVELLNISFETVKTHRQNIRKKLGIYGERGGLRSHLMQFVD